MNDELTKPDLSEQYSSAVSTSNLRVQSERRTSADIVIAAGMNPQRIGIALRRLATEWDAQAKPKKASPEIMAAMQAGYPRLETGMVIYKGQTITPAMAAHREAQDWYAHELGLVFQRLKTLPEVRSALVHWATDKGIEGPEHVVCAVLQWWLHPTCPKCNGVKFKIIAGTGRTGSKACPECKGSGEKKVPHGWAGIKVRDHINSCLSWAVADMKRKFSHQRGKA